RARRLAQYVEKRHAGRAAGEHHERAEHENDHHARQQPRTFSAHFRNPHSLLRIPCAFLPANLGFDDYLPAGSRSDLLPDFAAFAKIHFSIWSEARSLALAFGWSSKGVTHSVASVPWSFRPSSRSMTGTCSVLRTSLIFWCAALKGYESPLI